MPNSNKWLCQVLGRRAPVGSPTCRILDSINPDENLLSFHQISDKHRAKRVRSRAANQFARDRAASHTPDQHLGGPPCAAPLPPSESCRSGQEDGPEPVIVRQHHCRADGGGIRPRSPAGEQAEAFGAHPCRSPRDPSRAGPGGDVFPGSGNRRRAHHHGRNRSRRQHRPQRDAAVRRDQGCRSRKPLPAPCGRPSRKCRRSGSVCSVDSA